jgi:TonB-dependent starch-binding outer membrane protein SusC
MKKHFPALFLCIASPFLIPPNLQAQQADSTVQIGYGAQKQAQVTGAITHLDQKQFNKGIIYDWNQLWQGLVPGFTVARPGSNPNDPYQSRIRNLHSINLRSEPLYVVDGVPGVSISSVDPSEIVSVDVLRDAASTAIYGGRGAAGVVLINTRPSEPGFSAAYSAQIGTEQASALYDAFNQSEYLKFGGKDLSPDDKTDTDWQDLILQRAMSQTHHLSLRQVRENGSFFQTRFNYRNVGGILKKTGFEQYNATALFSEKVLNNRLVLTGGINAQLRATEKGTPEAYHYALNSNPTMPVRTSDPAYAEYSGYFQARAYNTFNPVAMIEQSQNTENTRYLLGHLKAEAQLLPGLHAGLMIAKEQTKYTAGQYYDRNALFGNYIYDGKGQGSQTSRENSRQILESTLSYKFSVSRLSAQVLAGYGWQQNNTSGMSIVARGIISDALANNNLGAFLSIQKGTANVESFKKETTLLGLFGRASLQWDNMYFLNAGIRRDGASQLGRNARFGNFPFISAGADVARFLKFDFLQNLKLRAGYGVSGNAVGESGLSQTTYREGSVFYYNGTYNPSYGVALSGNPNLGWEKHRERNMGFDFALFKNRLRGTFDGFWARSTDLIAMIYTRDDTYPASWSGTNTWQNKAQLNTQGKELTLSFEAIRRQNIEWSFGINGSSSKAILSKSIYPKDSIAYSYPSGGCFCATNYQLLYQGGGIGTFWGPVARPALNDKGEVLYVDLDKDGIIRPDVFDKDQTRIGTPQPKWEYGIQQHFRWQRFELDFALRGVSGHDLMHEIRLYYEPLEGIPYWNRVRTKYFDPNRKIARNFDNRYIERASFLRMQYAVLRYRIPTPVRWGFRDLSVQLGGQNLFTFSRYSGLDPELRITDAWPRSNSSQYFSVGGWQNLSAGIDRLGTLPPTRSWWVGLKVGF